jgi:DNA repair exonuclease SbcCD ATPase subunit
MLNNRFWSARFVIGVLILLFSQVGQGRGSDGCGMPAMIDGVDVKGVCSRLGVSYRSIYGPDRSSWIEIASAGDCDRVRAEVERLLTTSGHEGAPPEALPEGQVPENEEAADRLQADYREISRQANELYERGEYAASARLAEQTIPLAKKINGPDHWIIASHYGYVAMRYEKAGDLAATEKFLKLAVAAAERSGREETISIARRNLQDFYRDREAARVRQQEEQRKKEEAERARQIQQLRSEMKPLGTGEGAPGYGSQAEMKPLDPRKTYPAPPTAWEQALCACHFSAMARQAASAEDARFYSAQAESVMTGGPTYVECPSPKLSMEKQQQVRQIGEAIAAKTVQLHVLDAQIGRAMKRTEEIRARKGETVRKKEQAKQKAADARKELQEAVPEPQRQKELQDLLALAEQELQEAETQLERADQELQEAEKAEKEISGKKDELEHDIGGLQEQMQNAAAEGQG